MSNSDIFQIKCADKAASKKNDVWQALQLENVIDGYVSHIEDQAVNLALQAAKAAVPIKTGELREAIEVNSSGGVYRVSVNSSLHTSSVGKKKLTNVQLADYLATTPFSRSRASLGSGIFTSVSGSTAGWIDIAKSNLTDALNGLK